MAGYKDPENDHKAAKITKLMKTFNKENRTDPNLRTEIEELSD